MTHTLEVLGTAVTALEHGGTGSEASAKERAQLGDSRSGGCS